MEAPVVFTTLGILLLGGLAVEWVGRHLPLPRVTLLILFGVLIGPDALNLLPDAAVDTWFRSITTLAMVMIGFLVGERFSLDRLRIRGRLILTMSAVEALGTAAVVTAGMLAFGAPVELALLLGGIAPATAPASTYDVVQESRANGPFTETLLGIIGLDDAWCLLIFGLASAVTASIIGEGSASVFIYQGIREIGGAILLGSLLGVAAGILTQRIDPGQPTLIEAIAIVLLTAGVAMLFDLSYILTAVVLGAVMTNLARHHDKAFHEIEHLEWPLLLLFFVLAGASLHIEDLAAIGALGFAYIILRVVGKLVGARLGANLADADTTTRKWTGLALMPQAGVALGLALLANQRFPEVGEVLLPLAVASTVIFEVLGPSGTRLALRQSGETKGPE